MTEPTTAHAALAAGLARSTLGEPAVPAMSYPIMVDGVRVGWSASCYETARSLDTELVVARVAAAGPRPCADCGGFGHGPDTMQGGEHDNGPCPTCNGSGLATPFEDCGAPNRVTGRESAAQEAWDRQAELLDGADLPDLDTDGGGR